MSPGRHFPGRSPSGPLCPVQISTPRPHPARASKRLVSAPLGGEPGWDGGHLFFLDGEAPGAPWTTCPTHRLVHKDTWGHPPPFSDPSPEPPISGQPPKPTPGLSPSLPLGPLIRSATVLMRIASKQTGEEGSACSQEGGLARGRTPQRGSRCSREGPPVGVLIRASELEGLHPHVPRLWGHESPPLWLSMEPAVDAAGTKRDRCQLLRRRVPVPGGTGAGNPGGAPTEPPQLPSALPVASDCF